MAMACDLVYVADSDEDPGGDISRSVCLHIHLLPFVFFLL